MRTDTQQMLHGPLIPTLLRLAAPNILGLFAMTLVIGYDGYILGLLGANALAGVALVLPLSMLMLQMSAGGIGGATTAAVARALGAGRADDAGRLAQHALVIGAVGALLFTAVHWLFGRALFTAMGGHGAALDDAMAYAGVIFSGAVFIWATNVLSAIVRGGGNMLLPALALVGTALLHLVLSPTLVFGWGPFPALGVTGAAASTLATNAFASILLLGHLLGQKAAVRLRATPWNLRSDVFGAILRVGIPAAINPVISNTSIALATAYVGSFGIAALAGFGVAARLEYILVPIAFGFGTALTAMVATNMGAKQTARALRVTWTGAAIVAAITGAIGITTALAPSLWMNLFTADEQVRAAGSIYLNIVGASYALFGLGLALFFASQGAGRMLWPIVGSTLRLLIVAVGGWICIHVLHAPATAFYLVVAASFTVYALAIAASIYFGGWRDKAVPSAQRMSRAAA